MDTTVFSTTFLLAGTGVFMVACLLFIIILGNELDRGGRLAWHRFEAPGVAFLISISLMGIGLFLESSQITI
jgi:hypothetical protein